MKKKRVPTKKDLPQPPAGPGAPPRADEAAPTEESKLRAWIDEMDRRRREETIKRAGDRLRAEQKAAERLGLGPAAPTEEPPPRVEQEARDRGSDPLRPHGRLAEEGEPEPRPAPEDAELEGG